MAKVFRRRLVSLAPRVTSSDVIKPESGTPSNDFTKPKLGAQCIELIPDLFKGICR
jgi:hypothetical protein